MTVRRRRSVACSPEEWAEVRYRAAQSEMSISAFLVERALQGGTPNANNSIKLTPREERDCYDQVVRLGEQMTELMTGRTLGLRTPQALDFIFDRLRNDMVTDGRIDEMHDIFGRVVDERKSRLRQIKDAREYTYTNEDEDEHYI